MSTCVKPHKVADVYVRDGASPIDLLDVDQVLVKLKESRPGIHAVIAVLLVSVACDLVVALVQHLAF